MTPSCPNDPISVILDQDRYPLHAPESDGYRKLLDEKRTDWRERGAVSLPGFLRPAAVAMAAAELQEPMARRAFWQRHDHNIYFSDETEGVPDDIARPGLTTSHRTLTCDQLRGSVIRRVYEWDPLRHFIRDLMNLPALHRMADPMACLNVMAYGQGDTLNWHFDRARFAVTVLLQSPDSGGQFEYCRTLRSEQDPNYDGVRQLLAGRYPDVRQGLAGEGTMTVFAGYASAHRVAPVTSTKPRMMAVLSYMEEPDYHYNATDRIRFYGRANPEESIPA